MGTAKLLHHAAQHSLSPLVEPLLLLHWSAGLLEPQQLLLLLPFILLIPLHALLLLDASQLPLAQPHPVLPPSLFPPLPSPPPSTLCELDQFNIVNIQQ